MKEVHEVVGVGKDCSCIHGSSLDLAVMLGVEGGVVMDEDELVELDKELSGL
jgi:hypothetical protein